MEARLAVKRAASRPEGALDRRGFEERALPHLRAPPLDHSNVRKGFDAALKHAEGG
jgi:hypothetical protein